MSSSDFSVRLGYTFVNADLLTEALTHPSRRYETRKTSIPDNQRLEFLGDAVLQMAVTERLYILFPQAQEGELTQWRATLVSRAHMQTVATTIQLGDALILGHGEERNGGRTRSSNLANAMEAVIGAVYQDSGWAMARDLVLRLLGPALNRLQAGPELAIHNAKGELQELLQKEGGDAPVYRCLSEAGAAHDRCYEVAVEWQNREIGRGTGKSKREAEVNAARQALALKCRMNGRGI